MQKQFFFLSPIEVVKVTSQNLEEAAEWCGGSVQETESRRVEGRMDKYILVPTPSEKNISWAFPGMFITKRLVVTVKDELRSTFAVFRRDYFEKNYFDSPKSATDKTWEREESERHAEVRKAHVGVTVENNLGQALLQAQQREAEKHADALMARKSSGELHDLLKNGHITTNDYRRHTGYTGELNFKQSLEGKTESEVEKVLNYNITIGDLSQEARDSLPEKVQRAIVSNHNG